MKNDIDAILDDLLALWHRFAEPYQGTRGYANASPSFRDVKSNWSPYDRDNNVPEQEAERDLARTFGEALFRVPNTPQMWRSVLMFEARNLSSGYQVWNSVRLPRGEEFEVLRLEARNMLLLELRRDGIIG